jgi:GTP cyclohydrolase I
MKKRPTSQPRRPSATSTIDSASIEKAVHQLLLAVGEDPRREGLKETPCRVARMYQEILSGMADDPIDQLKVYTAKNEDEMILVKNIAFHSLCEHHLLPFFGKVHIAYIPRGNKITGFSSLVKVVEAEHLCLTMRGVKKPGSSVVTSAIRGGMKRESTRLEALSLIKGRM